MFGGFNGLDIFIFVIVIVGIAVGFTQGLLRQVIGLAALYIGAILGAQYYSVLSGFLHFIFSSVPLKFMNAISFFIIVGASALVVDLLARDAYQSTKLQLLPIVDHLGGAILGLVTPLITITIVIPVLTFATGESWPLLEQTRFITIGALQTSRLLPLFDHFKPLILNAVSPWLPAGLPSVFNF